MITEDYVSYETAKLLKEKGFNEIKCNTCYKWNGNFCNNRRSMSGIDNEICYQAPTFQMAMKWLRKNFNMNPVPYATSIGGNFEVFDLSHRDITGCALLYDAGIPSKEKMFETYEEACEAGIRYCLENLI